MRSGFWSIVALAALTAGMAASGAHQRAGERERKASIAVASFRVR